MANAFEQIDWIGAEALTHMEDSLVIAGMCAKDKSADFNVKPNGYAVGDTIGFKIRPEYTTEEFSTVTVTQGIRESKRSMTIEKHFDITVALTASELAMDFENFSDQVIKPAIYSIANSIDVYVATKIMDGQGLYVSDTLLETAADMALARKAANIQQLGRNRFAIVDGSLEATMLGKDFFNQAQIRGSRGEDTLATGIMGQVMGIDWYSSLNFDTPTSAFTPGTAAGTTDNTVATDNLIGNTVLITDALGAGTLKVGDHLAIAGVKRPLIVKTAVADTTLTTSIDLVDPINEIIPDGAAVTVIGTTHNYTKQGAIFDGQSLAFAMPILDAPEDKWSTSVSSNGISLRIVKGYTMSSKTTTLSIDCLVGAFALDSRKITLLASY